MMAVTFLETPIYIILELIRLLTVTTLPFVTAYIYSRIKAVFPPVRACGSYLEWVSLVYHLFD